MSNVKEQSNVEESGSQISDHGVSVSACGCVDAPEDLERGSDAGL